jgi:hypothetical protein
MTKTAAKKIGQVAPTEQMYAELQEAFDFFNAELFADVLPACLITLQRQKRTQGYFSADRFTNRDGTRVDEIAMNPSYFAVQSIMECLQTLVHEMGHSWQSHFGSPGRTRYHNKEWADKMQNIGLMPSDTGRPGGKKTGDCMSDYVIPGGPFERAYKQLITKNFALSWLDRFPVSMVNLAHTLHQLPEEVQLSITEEELQNLSINIVEHDAKKQSTVRYRCPMCDARVWGKPKLELMCLQCKEVMPISGGQGA